MKHICVCSFSDWDDFYASFASHAKKACFFYFVNLFLSSDQSNFMCPLFLYLKQVGDILLRSFSLFLIILANAFVRRAISSSFSSSLDSDSSFAVKTRVLLPLVSSLVLFNISL